MKTEYSSRSAWIGGAKAPNGLRWVVNPETFSPSCSVPSISIKECWLSLPEILTGKRAGMLKLLICYPIYNWEEFIWRVIYTDQNAVYPEFLCLQFSNLVYYSLSVIPNQLKISSITHNCLIVIFYFFSFLMIWRSMRVSLHTGPVLIPKDHSKTWLCCE